MPLKPLEWPKRFLADTNSIFLFHAEVVCNGKPTLRGKRITVQTILEFLSAGDSEEEILEQYPGLESEDIRACLRFASGLMSGGYDLEKVV